MMSPSGLSAALRSIAVRIDNSSNPSRSAVAAELRRVLANFGEEPQSQQAAPATKVVISDNWMADDLPNIMSEHGGVSVRQGFFGEYGVEMPADQAALFQADVGEGVHIFNSWEAASKAATESGEEPYEFEVIPDDELGGTASAGVADGVKATIKETTDEATLFSVKGTTRGGTEIDAVVRSGQDGDVDWEGEGPFEAGDEDAGWDEVLLAISAAEDAA